MKKPYHGKMLSFLLASALAVHAAGAAEETSESQSEAYRASVAQDTLKTDVTAIKAELNSLREEMRQLMPQDVATVDRAFKQLDSLSRNEMAKAVESLRNASRTGDMKSQLSLLSGTVKDQGTIGTSLKRMAIDLNARQSIASVGPKLSEILERQVSAMNEVTRLAKIENLPAKLRDKAKRRLEVVVEDQNGITEDVKIVVKQIDDLAQNLPEESRKPLIKASAAARDGKIGESADNAAQLTGAGPFDQAITNQKSVTRILMQMQSALADGKLTEQLQAMLDRLIKILDSQRSVADVASKVGVKRPMPYESQRLEAGLSDQSSSLSFEMLMLNARASGEVLVAQQAMEKAVTNFIRMWEERADAQQNTQEAVKQLEAAKAELEKQIAEVAEKAPKTAQELAAQLDSLQREVALAAMEQNKAAQAAKTPNSPFAPSPAQKQALQAKVEDLQQRALPLSPDAAQKLSDAAQQMPQAPAEAQEAAAVDLAQAAQMLAQQLAALTGRTPEQLALAKAENQLAQAAQQTAQAQKDLQSTQTSPQAVNELNAAKQEAAAALQTAAAGDLPTDAQQAMQQAQQALQQAQMDAAQTKLGQAQADAQQAQQAMQQAQQSMQQAQKAIAQQAASVLPGNQPGTPSPDGPPQDSQGNGGGGPSGDHLKGAGAEGGPAQVVTGLSPRDRDAVTQLQNDKPPREFVSEVQQYYKNLADGAGF